MPRAPVVLADLRDDDRHDTGPYHPERPSRLDAVRKGIEAAGLHDAVAHVEPVEASIEQLSLAHDVEYVEALRRFVASGGGNLDLDTVASPGSWRTALLAAGAGLAVIDALRDGAGGAGFVAVRPPGHHATATHAMGFCLFNNVAIGAAALVEAGERVAIVDWDVHHGNGTEAIFWDNPRVLYVSLHQAPAYPGTGHARHVGGPNALGLTLNVPLPPRSTGAAMRVAFDELVAPAIAQFGPTWVLVSAGFDAHRDDPLADLRWSAADYAHLTRQVMSFVPSGRVVAYLEGGYDLDALARSAGATIAALAGEDWCPEPASNGGPVHEIAAVARERDEAIERGGDASGSGSR
ncbi:MAG TPA: histone deacetylase [Acidimicrobiales bacterium]